jgi:hypothetical protein
MTIPANLFVEAPEIQDRSLTKLENDFNAWPEEIIQKLRERVPQSANLNTMVKFMKKDEENGTATGSVVIHSADTAVTVPVIVKDFTLFPLDVMIAKGKLLPLTQDYFNAIISKNDVFERIEEYPSYGGLGRFEDANLWNAIYPPSLGRYAYASAGYPMLDLLSDHIDGAPLKEWIKANPEYAMGFYKNGHAPLIKKLAHLQPVNMNEFAQGARNLIPTIRILKLEAPNKYSLLSSSDQVFSPALEAMTREGAMRFLSTISDCVQDDMNDVDQNGEKILQAPEGGKVILALPESHNENVEEAKEFDHYVVKNKNGLEIEGLVIPKVIDFDQKPSTLKIFIGKAMGTIQSSIWGIRVKNSRFRPPFCTPRIGQTGTFMYQPDKSHALATVPVTIHTVAEHEDGLCLKAMDLMGRALRIKLCPGLHQLQRIAVSADGTYILPPDMKWVPMEGFDEITNSLEAYAIKTASRTLTDRPVKLSPNGHNYFTLRGVDKYAQAAGWDHTNLDSAQAKFLLACLGCPMDKIAKTFKVANRRGVAELHNLNFIPTIAEKVASFKPKAANLIKHAKAIKRNLFKEASFIDNAQTVDAMLSLNFITPSNISKFIGKIPHFKATISHLASAILASRLGMKEIPEEATAVAMEKLVEVIDGLEKLRASQEVMGQQ